MAAQNVPAKGLSRRFVFEGKMKKLALTLAAFILTSGCGVKAFKSKRFWAETGAVVAAATADGITTNQLLRRCVTCEERVGKVFLGRRPGTARIFLTGVLFHGLKRAAIAYIWQRDSELGPRLSTTDAVVFGAGHAVFAWRNTRVKQ